MALMLGFRDEAGNWKSVSVANPLPVSGGGGGSADPSEGGLTDAELRATPLLVKLAPVVGSNHAIVLNSAAAPGSLGNYPCTQTTVFNTTDQPFYVAQSGSGTEIPIAPGAHFTFRGITNANVFTVRIGEAAPYSGRIVYRTEL